jgi:hypothetical protein
MSNSFFEEAVDTLDDEVFSGDSLVNQDNRELLKKHCEAWLREIEKMEEVFSDQSLKAYINHSGGADGSDYEWECIGRGYGVETVAYSFAGHSQRGLNPKILNDEELNEGEKKAKLADLALKRKWKVTEHRRRGNWMGSSDGNRL